MLIKKQACAHADNAVAGFAYKCAKDQGRDRDM